MRKAPAESRVPQKLKQAEAAGEAIETPTNFFLFFDSKSMANMHH